MKRSKKINLALMRKTLPSLKIRPLALAVTAVALASCSSKEEVHIVGSVEECIERTSLDLQECEAAYKRALIEAESTAPRYRTLAQCRSEFGYNGCVQHSSGSSFVPFMAGFMIGQILDRNHYYNGYRPVFRYDRPYSDYNNR